MMSKINLRNLKLKSHEEYLICRTYSVWKKDLIFKLNRKVEKPERNDKITVDQNLRPFFLQLLQLNQDFFYFEFYFRRHHAKHEKVVFCYSYGLIEMLLQAWPYRVPSNQELTIINSIFYNLMQSRFIINFLLIQRVYN